MPRYNDPTEAEIQERIAEIQANWDDKIRSNRWKGKPREEWTVPTFKVRPPNHKDEDAPEEL